MIRLLVRFLLLAALAAGFAWIADRPGTIVIRWLNREIETSVLAGLAGLIFAVLALWFLFSLLRRLIGTPGAIGGYLRFRKARRGYESLSRGIIAAGAGDGQSAHRHAAIARLEEPGGDLPPGIAEWRDRARLRLKAEGAMAQLAAAVAAIIAGKS